MAAMVFVQTSSGCGVSSERAEDPNPMALPTEAMACPPGTVDQEGRCLEPGVDACAEGWVSDGERGCRSPSDDVCSTGSMRLPGETTCAPVASCGVGLWGDIPIEPGTQHVDGAYVGDDSDGSPERPWPSLAAALAAAEDGALVAVGPGVYSESVVIDRPIRLWGKCPAEVTIVGTSGPRVEVAEGATGVVIRGLHLTGGGAAVLTGLNVEATLKELWIEQVGRGIVVEREGIVSAERVIVDEVSDYALWVSGAEVHVDGWSSRAGIEHGVGLLAHLDGDVQPFVTMSRAAFEGHDGAVVAEGGRVELHQVTTIGAGVPDENAAIRVLEEPGSGLRSELAVSDAIIADGVGEGIVVRGSDASLARVTVRRMGAFGIYCERGRLPGLVRASVSVESSSVRHVVGGGVLALACDAVVGGVDVAGVAPEASGAAVGIGVASLNGDEEVALSSTPASLVVEDSEVADGGLSGIAVMGDSEARLTHTLVGATAGSEGAALDDGLLGDGVLGLAATVIEDGQIVGRSPHLVLHQMLIRDNRRAAVASFGASIALSDSEMRCNTFDVTRQDYSWGLPLEPAPVAQVVDEGVNACGCGKEMAPCKAVTAELVPPSLL